MKNIVRAFALSLVVAGAVAVNTTSAKAIAQHPTVSAASAMPVPNCPLHDPNGCGIDKM